MKAVDFKSKIKNNRMLIPEKIQPELNAGKGRDIRVIVLVEDADIYDDMIFRQTAQDQFLKGYADSDSVYDNF